MTGHGRFSASLLAVIVTIYLNGCTSAPGSRLLGRGLPLPGRHSASSQLKNPAKLHLSYAKLQERLGHAAEARHSYESALGEQPKSVEAILGLARLDQLAGRHHEAEQGFQRALELAPNDPKVLDSVAQFFVSQQNWDRAVELLQRAVAAQPDDTSIRHRLAIALASSGDTDAALAHFDRTVGDAAAHYNVALILYEQGKVQQAEQHLLQAVIKQPDLQEAQVWLDEIRRTRESAEMLASTGDPRFEELPPPQQQTADVSLENDPRPQNPPVSARASAVSEPAPAFGYTVDSAPLHSESPIPTLQASHTPPPNASLTPDPSSMTPEQFEQWKNSVTPAQFEQWRNQMNQ